MNETEKQFSFTRAAPNKRARQKPNSYQLGFRGMRTPVAGGHFARRRATLLAGAALLFAGLDATRAQTYTYDAIGRLTETRYDATHFIRYAYDLQDNLTNVTVTASQGETDSDGDGLPDAWELVYFNTLTNTAAGDPNQDGWSNLTHFQNGTDPLDPDTDDDDMSNVDERRAGTSPTNAASFLDFHSIALSPAGTAVVVQWQSVAGHRYRLQRSTNLLMTPPFIVNLKTNILATPPLNTETNALPTGARAFFYRIMLE
jgi:YD repeat-containing protein